MTSVIRIRKIYLQISNSSVDFVKMATKQLNPYRIMVKSVKMAGMDKPTRPTETKFQEKCHYIYIVKHQSSF